MGGHDRDQYRRLFPDDHEKAKAFDQIAEHFYFANFGSTSKADIDLLLFSIYLDRLLDLDESNPQAYSDYSLSKVLAVPQSRISSMKVKKQLKYPRESFNWKEAYQRCATKAVFAEGKIKVYINDINVYLEIKNAIEEAGGYVEKTLTANLLQVAPAYYADLMMKIRGEKERKELYKTLKIELDEQDKLKEVLEQESLPELFMKSGVTFAADKITNLVGIPFLSEPVADIAKRLISFFKERKKHEADWTKND